MPSIRIGAGSTRGSTQPGSGWQEHGNGVTLLVDTTSAKFTQTPTYTISLSGPGGNMWIAGGGAASVYEPTATSFKVYILAVGRSEAQRLQRDQQLEVVHQLDWCPGVK
ncbi:hypothetical protein [Saccharopolyspora sp. ASAGF58]|uniref:hypothetical protein n=1 Tax=Saccharopolyspora sp. ASAGF58 TaxID=2719023 RepID=UPI00143FD103|nr:hypothetical protein [Saccharopolyspora sp. ASAGF58]QIZ37087.1 hypothetical protein FDZ84_23680 [Saccharopolyspora sp. ASAGF58]